MCGGLTHILQLNPHVNQELLSQFKMRKQRLRKDDLPKVLKPFNQADSKVSAFQHTFSPAWPQVGECGVWRGGEQWWTLVGLWCGFHFQMQVANGLLV
jgi:hypothetical protein